MTPPITEGVHHAAFIVESEAARAETRGIPSKPALCHEPRGIRVASIRPGKK